MQIGGTIELSEQASRHVQVLRMQPGETVRLFPGHADAGNQEFTARILHMGRRSVSLQVEAMEIVNRELPRAIHLAVGMPSNDRMDWLVEKATELGAASITPLITERTVLRLQGERAEKKRQHWQAIAIAACEQCGRNTVPEIHPLTGLSDYLRTPPGRQDSPALHQVPLPGSNARDKLLLGFSPGSIDVRQWFSEAAAVPDTVHVLSGPEGGLSVQEEHVAAAYGFSSITLGPRVLRAETAPLHALAAITLRI
ncbi:16S rRNA (uracil(1498)-N(3))-methyltransferase [Corticibacter populi]|uniref:16S rRNA (uracil(1498)-N(3))-methyltransferase n=1 Tax=Corticibacter populi TaxID=1550736 RepID=UPI001F5FC822|nr:16S rRNA (uracil(1498)-N(3))-methyltransferase [Corticibacter populi]